MTSDEQANAVASGGWQVKSKRRPIIEARRDFRVSFFEFRFLLARHLSLVTARQLFFDVTVKNEPNCCSTFLLLHLGQVTRFLSCSAMVKVRVKFFLHSLHLYS